MFVLDLREKPHVGLQNAEYANKVKGKQVNFTQDNSFSKEKRAALGGIQTTTLCSLVKHSII